ncbi:phage tail protein [Hymenobacter swuensis]|uniref:Microcystin dependent protein n=1 Tax=Hymenobacter swuensis DY53 TaxID=1227739 RepID=W8FAY8_9BACT|nr:tail fiber protein [Hymenobacter swuensis]AHJ99806.1 microcystin dependent protein [Hymenobacter swuensis DY53]
MPLRSTTPVGPTQPARRSLLKRLSGLVAGSFLAGPLQALLGRATPAAAGTLSGGDGVFVAEIITVPFNFAPKGYARCDGQLLPIFQNTALFSLLGTTYGGDGKSTFALPNLNGRVAVGAGQGQGLSLYDLGQTGGGETVELLGSELPAHSHTLDLTYSTELGTLASPENAYLASNGSGRAQYEATGTGSTASVFTGQAQPHNNLQPYLTLTFCIALQGIFPPRG